jgi:hypothetical protein
MTMSTADLPPKTQSCIDGDAFDLICCFYDGVDDIVHEVARQIAEVEGSFAPEEPCLLLVNMLKKLAARSSRLCGLCSPTVVCRTLKS